MVLTILDYLGIRGSGDMTYSTPHGYRVEGAGSAEADGLYVRDGEYGGAPLFKKVPPALALTPAPTLARFLALALPLTLP